MLKTGFSPCSLCDFFASCILWNLEHINDFLKQKCFLTGNNNDLNRINYCQHSVSVYCRAFQLHEIRSLSTSQLEKTPSFCFGRNFNFPTELSTICGFHPILTCVTLKGSCLTSSMILTQWSLQGHFKICPCLCAVCVLSSMPCFIAICLM